MKKAKPCPADTPFRAKARKHQSEFREKVLGVDFDGQDQKAKYGNVLPKEAALNGLNFYEGYRKEIVELAKHKFKKVSYNPLLYNLLRSEHIPFNIFGPMTLNKTKARDLICELIGCEIAIIEDIFIEFAGEQQRENYLDDRTSFDAFILYKTKEVQKGGIGIEVKYTEGGYSKGEKEKKDIEKADGRYRTVTKTCGYFEKPDFEMLSKDEFRQIWRNHILGAAMIQAGDIKHFHCIHLYPKGNTHFDLHAIPEYKRFLTPKGKESFIGLTYEELFQVMGNHFDSDKETKWIDYLKQRYLF
jgi:hypothetical protein